MRDGSTLLRCAASGAVGAETEAAGWRGGSLNENQCENEDQDAQRLLPGEHFRSCRAFRHELRKGEAEDDLRQYYDDRNPVQCDRGVSSNGGSGPEGRLRERMPIASLLLSHTGGRGVLGPFRSDLIEAIGANGSFRWKAAIGLPRFQLAAAPGRSETAMAVGARLQPARSQRLVPRWESRITHP